MFATSLEVQTLLALCDEVQTPVAYKAELLIRARNWEGLVSLSCDPKQYSSAEHYLRDAQVVSFLRKHPSVPLGKDVARNNAVKSFWEAERQCYKTNERLSPLLFDLDHYGERLGRFIRLWRKEIRKVLGKVPSKSFLEGRFGPGSTFENVGDLITVADKLDDKYSTTRQTLDSFSSVWDETAWSRYAASNLTGVVSSDIDGFRGEGSTGTSHFSVRDFNVVRGNRFTTVPKTAKTDRGICIEPSLNVYYQLALGQWLSDRLKKVLGWDKATVQQDHRNLARIGSLTGANATIDLSSASDTVSKNLVKLLLPPGWFDLVDQLRSPVTLLDRHHVRLEKFSSMGNGFTFELETLIFYTLALCVVKHGDRQYDLYCPGAVVSAFGDDLIVPRECGEDLVSALRYFGFSVNKDKTFLSGPFRESCGGDYFRGYDVRPFFLKKDLNEPAHSIACANGLRRYYNRIDCCSTNAYVRRARLVVLNKLPRAIVSAVDLKS